ncbi:unnamed protein product [Rodentolepis nana]|uniref:Uncharacterized protein n=1 Tax=Rodentolepis nana TaxID=102285 RepID=A0A0R3TU21_RODNA|nr:unnamed protein product [Rodentolepis nana]
MNALSFSPPLLDSTFPPTQLPGFRSLGNGLMPLPIPGVIFCGPGARHPPHTSPNIKIPEEGFGVAALDIVMTIKKVGLIGKLILYYLTLYSLFTTLLHSN